MTSGTASQDEAPDALAGLVRAEIMQPVQPAVIALARAVVAQHGSACRAVLFYGSCLREGELEGRVLDFYLIVSSYRAAYGPGWRALANRLIPPNVFSLRHGGLSAKYAVLSDRDFRHACGPGARDASVWARFSQPSRLVWSSDSQAADNIVECVAHAAPMLVDHALPLVPADKRADPLAAWTTGFELSYSCELRAEREGRAAAIVAADWARYVRFGEVIMGRDRLMLSPSEARRRWRSYRRWGRALSVLRLLKATTTFRGGVEYAVWKINRHAGTAFELRPWQRRWPLFGAVALLPRLLKRGVIR